jgi:hypothetical protein
MVRLLEAPGPHPAYADKLMLFGRLVGSWDIASQGFDEHGAVIKESVGEWHFGWVLEGRGIQDVLISPPLAGREPGQESRSYDAALRVYDPNIDAWHVMVVFPVYRATIELIAREQGSEIWQEGRNPDGNLVRWTFSDFRDEQVRWRGFFSRDNGATWLQDEEIVLRRRS